MSFRRVPLVRRSRRDNLPVLADALMGFLVGVAELNATLATHGGAATIVRTTDYTRGGYE